MPDLRRYFFNDPHPVRHVNPHLEKLQPYPFEKLRQLFAQVSASPSHKAISLGTVSYTHLTLPTICSV